MSRIRHSWHSSSIWDVTVVISVFPRCYETVKSISSLLVSSYVLTEELYGCLPLIYRIRDNSTVSTRKSPPDCRLPHATWREEMENSSTTGPWRSGIKLAAKDEAEAGWRWVINGECDLAAAVFSAEFLCVKPANPFKMYVPCALKKGTPWMREVAHSIPFTEWPTKAFIAFGLCSFESTYL